MTMPIRLTPERPALVRLFGRGAAARRVDWPMVAAALALMLVGSVLSWSATAQQEINQGGNPHFYLDRQLVNAAIGVALGAAVTAVDYRRIRPYAIFIYGAAMLLLATVLTPIASTVNGAHSWIVLGGGLSVQPSEFTKPAVILLMAALLADAVDARDAAVPTGRQLVAALLVALVPAGIIMAIHELGTAMVLGAIAIGVVAVAGMRARWLAAMAGVGAVVVFAAVQLHVLSQYQVDRFAAFADPRLDPSGVGYNAQQARIAIGSGGLLGAGLFHGSQTNGGYVPEQHTDFVFTVAGEEFGFVGGIVLIGLFGVVLWRALGIARHAGDRFGTLVAAGVVCWIAFEAFENIGMTLGIMPVAGIPLPLVSYGGSSMFATCIALGLLQSVRIRAGSGHGSAR
ncbi:rod shape-determining protein RodA [Mangrovactinospora gilvigrisea]|uniref:peptidoglycan glycosyltransferase n=1 Tax=Mangrovactinospora gilvigrisea TaxID=1428644 RepID=A0A1J7BQM8_9ACTN|nr:rod shape-determining protein RodA [Mangrovactinospora gilvigrisea]OIV35753.1 rod shape-determining protein RodA [Mangrovactinospora gilvigrisea]